jgi:nitrogen regulatory protein PII
MYKLLVSIVRHEKIEDVISALKKAGVAFTYSEVKGFCGEVHLYKEDIHERIRIEIVAQDEDVDRVKNIITANACCGLEGDGCLSVYIVDEYITFNPL